MNDMVRQQNEAVLQHLQRKREYTDVQLKDVSWTISKAHKTVIRRVNDYLNEEYKRVEREIEQLEQQLIAKLAERSELHAWFHRIGYQDATQDKVQSYLE